MRLQVRYFARLREQLGCAAEVVEVAAPLSVAALLEDLQQRGEPWQSQLYDATLMVAVNQCMATRAQVLGDGDEVAFFPPVTGG